MTTEPLRFSSRLLQDGAYASSVARGDEVADLRRVASALGMTLACSPGETPLDAFLRTGRFVESLPAIAEAIAGARDPRVGAPAPPLVRPGKIVALGRTYREHARELGNEPCAEPLVFEKLADCIAPSGSAVTIPPRALGRMDYEAELALVIGTGAAMLPDGNGRRAIAAALVANDLTLRSVQKAAQKAGHPWLLAKNFPGACVFGPEIVAVGDGAALDDLLITCTVAGSVRQEASTAGLVWPVGRLVEWISHVLPLNAGDVILTGTPAGTGPLAAGERCTITIRGPGVDLGRLEVEAR